MTYFARMKRGFGSTFSFFVDCWTELKKVKWPSRKELISYTIVVMSTVVFVTIYFFFLDIIISWLVRLVTG